MNEPATILFKNANKSICCLKRDTNGSLSQLGKRLSSIISKRKITENTEIHKLAFFIICGLCNRDIETNLTEANSDKSKLGYCYVFNSSDTNYISMAILHNNREIFNGTLEDFQQFLKNTTK